MHRGLKYPSALMLIQHWSAIKFNFELANLFWVVLLLYLIA